MAERGPELPYDPDPKNQVIAIVVIVAIVVALLFVIAWPRSMC